MRRRRHQDDEKKLFSKGTMISLFIVTIMVLSIAGFIVTQNDQFNNDVEYNGYTFSFSEVRGDWQTRWQGGPLHFYYDPYSAEQAPLEGDPLTLLDGAKAFSFTYRNDSLYVADMALVQYDFQQMLDQNLGIYVERGLSFENSYGVKVISCADATAAMPVILFQEGNETKLMREGSCIVAQARTQSDVYLLGDRILYHLYGIIA